MKGRCYYKLPMPYFVQYTGNNKDEVIEFLHEIYDAVFIDNCEIKEVETDEGKILKITYGDDYHMEEIAANIGDFVITGDGYDEEMHVCNDSKFHHLFHIANDDIADYDEGGAE